MGNKRGSSIVIVISNINCYKHFALDHWRQLFRCTHCRLRNVNGSVVNVTVALIPESLPWVSRDYQERSEN